MGIIFDNAALLAKAHYGGVSFAKTLTIGHLALYLSRKELSRLAHHYGLNIDVSSVMRDGYADSFLQAFLGAKKVASLDVSDYQGSDIVHDMNLPIDCSAHEQYDAVIDGGVLEHIFNVPVAMANCMNLLKVGGSLFIITTCNNHAGHGFYQFSPELFFRVFRPENGFEIRDVILVKHPFPGAELSRRTRCYSVRDPALVNGRVGLVSRCPTVIMVHAQRTEVKPLFAQSPIQSDYAAKYARYEGGVDIRQTRKEQVKKILSHFPLQVKNYVTGKYQLLNYGFSNRRFYKKWDPF